MPHIQFTPNEITSFWSKIDQSGGSDACWPWTAYKSRYGAFSIRRDGRTILFGAHRVAFFLSHGHWGSPMTLHRCHNPACCNPTHLYEGTHADNMRDKVESGRAASGDRNGKRTHPESILRGERHPLAKLTVVKVREIRRRYAAGNVTQRTLAEDYGIDQTTISCIVLRRLWPEVD